MIFRFLLKVVSSFTHFIPLASSCIRLAFNAHREGEESALAVSTIFTDSVERRVFYWIENTQRGEERKGEESIILARIRETAGVEWARKRRNSRRAGGGALSSELISRYTSNDTLLYKLRYFESYFIQFFTSPLSSATPDHFTGLVASLSLLCQTTAR